MIISYQIIKIEKNLEANIFISKRECKTTEKYITSNSIIFIRKLFIFLLHILAVFFWRESCAKFIRRYKTRHISQMYLNPMMNALSL